MALSDTALNYERLSELRRTRRITALIAFAAGVVVMLALVWFSHWYGNTVRITDDYNRGRAFQDDADCELLAEATYGHDILVLQTDRPFDGWAPRSEQNFYRGCMGDGPLPACRGATGAATSPWLMRSGADDAVRDPAADEVADGSQPPVHQVVLHVVWCTAAASGILLVEGEHLPEGPVDRPSCVKQTGDEHVVGVGLERDEQGAERQDDRGHHGCEPDEVSQACAHHADVCLESSLGFLAGV